MHSNHGGGERFAVHSSHKGAPSSPTVVKKGRVEAHEDTVDNINPGLPRIRNIP